MSADAAPVKIEKGDAKPTVNTEAGEHEYNFKIAMSCGGCSGAVNRVLGKLSGVKSYDVDLDTQSARVITEKDLPYEKVLEVIKKTGKKVNEGEADGEKRSVDEV